MAAAPNSDPKTITPDITEKLIYKTKLQRTIYQFGISLGNKTSIHITKFIIFVLEFHLQIPVAIWGSHV